MVKTLPIRGIQAKTQNTINRIRTTNAINGTSSNITKNMPKESRAVSALFAGITISTFIQDFNQTLKENYFQLNRNLETGKLYEPDNFQKIAADDKRMFPIYEKAQYEKIPIIVHAGDSRYSYSNPLQLKNVYDNFHNLFFIAAHFGGYSLWDDDVYLLKETNFYFDTSSSLFSLNSQTAYQIINSFGAERFFFGTDFPMWSFKGELNRFLKLTLTDEQQEMIMQKNAENFLKNIKLNSFNS